MSCKRKFDDSDFDVATRNNAKQLKLVPFPNYVPDVDVTMSDAETDSSQFHHIRMHSNASTMSASSTGSVSPDTCSPAFDLYPSGGPYLSAVDEDPQTSNVKVGLLQPSASFSHHGSNCSQVPKLRLACASGLNGRRTMWSFCEQCGSISMVDND